MKMPEPITAPMPNAVRLHGPRVLARRLSGSSEAAISASMLLVRSAGIRACVVFSGIRQHRHECLYYKILLPFSGAKIFRRAFAASGAVPRYRFRWPCAARFTFFFKDPRATPEARFALGAAFLRAARFNFFLSVGS